MIFKDKNINDNLISEGYVILNWLDENMVNELLDFCFTNKINQTSGFSNSMNFGDSKISIHSNELIRNLFSTQLNKLMIDVEPIIGSFAIKGKGKNGRISLHQDWSITDENIDCSYNIWCALEDISFKNGCMGVLPKSHLQPFSIRGSMINNLYSKTINSNIFDYWINNFPVHYIHLKKGQALVYNQKLVHFSTENLTSKSRIAAGLVVTPKNAKLIHYNFDFKKNLINKMKVDKDFFFLKDIQFLNLDRFDLIEKINLDPKIDIVFDQVKNAYYPDNIGMINWIRKKYYKLKEK